MKTPAAVLPTTIDFSVQKINDHEFAIRMLGSELIFCVVNGTWADAHREAVRIWKGIRADRAWFAR